MRIILANHSSYPLDSDSRDGQPPRLVVGGPERGTDKHSANAQPADSVLEEIVHEQEAAQLDLITDGQIGWADPVSHLMARLDGVRLGGTLRFLNTNHYFRQPVIQAKLRRRRPLLLPEYGHARRAARVPVKPVLTGPYTLAKLSVIATTAYRGVASLARDLSMVLAEEVRTLVDAGAQTIQIDEPLILTHRQDIRLLRELLEPLQDAAGEAAQVSVASYFGDAEPLYAQLSSLPADIVALDCSNGSRLIEAIAETGSGKLLALGLIDGRSPQIEDPDRLARVLERVMHRYVHESIYLQPSCGLAHLPRHVARAKLGLLPRLRASFSGARDASQDNS